MSDEDYIIIAENLVKRYDQKVALNGIDLKVKRGEIYGFLGPNGAGKTTAVRILSTLTDFDGGTVIINGHNLKKNIMKAKVSVGVIQQHISLDKDLTVMENMRHRALMHQIPKNKREERIAELIEYFSLDEYLDSKIDSLSGGWKKRVSIICAIIHSPEIIFLDEPTVGLDIKARRLLWELIRLLNKDGTTVFLTTHYIEEAQALCDRVGIIDNGKIIADGTPSDLSESLGKFTVVATDPDGKSVYKYFPDRASASEYGNSMTNGEILIRRTNLEDCFVELTGRTVKN
ncbi:MAG: ABC transporter ATP-binding protein [Candidatus Methanomethylophilaceae archaeon]|jgi:ABC-2 type transport system ATP-binding protein